MKKFLLLFLLAAIARAEEIAIPDGRIFHHARIATFYAGEFVIEHDGGIAHVPWSEMNSEFQQRHPFDPEKTSAEKEASMKAKAEVLAKAAAEQNQVIAERSVKPSPTPTPVETAARPAPLPRDIAIDMTQSEVLEIWGSPRRTNTVWNGELRTDAWVYKSANLFFEQGRLARIQR